MILFVEGLHCLQVSSIAHTPKPVNQVSSFTEADLGAPAYIQVSLSH